MADASESPSLCAYTCGVVGPDGVNFSDLPTSLSALVEEHRTEAPQPGPER
ncbi:hypothetical protein ACFYSF_36560 [Streptomyces canus]|uniref:hypothetical protein n=1 Tax=Streptomyces canus TaxID=58343 RepID=UPI0036A206FD